MIRENWYILPNPDPTYALDRACRVGANEALTLSEARADAARRGKVANIWPTREMAERIAAERAS